MRIIKKSFITFLIISILLQTVSISANESKYQEVADKLAMIGVFKGTNNGYELNRPPTRIEGLIMLIRLLGKEDDAKRLYDETKAPYFSDVQSWARVYTQYAYENGLTKGIGNGLFGSDDSMTSSAYHTFVLRALGYDDAKGDFSWNNATEFMKSQGIISDQYYNEVITNDYLRDHVAKCSYDALYSTMKNSQVTLLDTLVQSGDIDKDLAKQVKIVSTKVKIIELDKYSEFVIIKNIGIVPVDMSGWTLLSVRGNQTFIFPEGFSLSEGEECRIISGAIFTEGRMQVGDLVMADTTIWNNQESDPAILLDQNGDQIDRVDEDGRFE